MNLPTRRSFFSRLALATAAVALFPRRAAAAPIIGGSTFTGTTTIPAGATLNIASGATINAAPGATITGWPTVSTPGPEVPADIAARLEALTPHYALFEIPFPESEGVTDIEIKGSENNFVGTAAQSLCYFYGSQYGVGQSSHGQIGLTLDLFYTDDLGKTNHGAARRWRRQNPSQSIFEQLQNASSKVGGVVVVVPICPANPAIRPDNSKLKFSYQFVGPAGMKENWRPCTPKWATSAPVPQEYVQITNPANPEGPPISGVPEQLYWFGGFRREVTMEGVLVPFTLNLTLQMNITSPGQAILLSGAYPFADRIWTTAGQHSVSIELPASGEVAGNFSIQRFDTNAVEMPTLSIVSVSSSPEIPNLLSYFHYR